MIARDEEITVGKTVDSLRGLVDEMVFVDNKSTDGTVDVVEKRCEINNIALHKYTAPVTFRMRDIRQRALEKGVLLEPDWFFICDADMIFKDPSEIRKLAEAGEYDQYWFETVNLTGGRRTLICGSVNEPHLWLFRNKEKILSFDNYVCTEDTHMKDPDDSRFLGWNLNGFKFYGRMFWRYQMWFSRKYNEENDTEMSVSDYMKMKFGEGGAAAAYQRVFVLNRLRRMGQFSLDKYDRFRAMSSRELKEKYMQFPKSLRRWPDCPFEIVYDKNREIIGRKPDLVNVSILADNEIEQIREIEEKSGAFQKGGSGAT